jgi:peptidoglycan lytic transglycosylase
MRGVPLGRGIRAGVAAVVCGALAACSSSGGFIGKIDPRYGVSASPRVIADGQQVPKGGGVYRIGNPYVVGGRTYVPQEDPHYHAEGLASWYGSDFHGRETANGEIYDMHGISAAHPTLPLPSYVRVTNLGNGRSLIVRVNDRGPYHSDRLIDLSAKAARLLDFHAEGLARVRIEYVGRAPLEGSDDNVLLATLREGTPAPAPSPILLASSRPFLPQIGGSNRMPQVRGAVPIPPGRPYTLGDNQGSSETRAAAVTAAVIRSRRTQIADEPDMRGAVERPMIASGPLEPAPVASFAPAPSVMTGRGLY